MFYRKNGGRSVVRVGVFVRDSKAFNMDNESVLREGMMAWFSAGQEAF